MTVVDMNSYSKPKLWGIVQEQGRIIGVISQAVISPKLNDRELRGRLIELLVTIGAIKREDLPKDTAAPQTIIMPDEPKIAVAE